MIANLGGSLLMMALVGIGFGVFYAILTRTKIMDGAKLNNGWTTSDLRKNFKYLLAFALLVAAIAGWFAGPTFFDAFGVAS